MKFAHAAIAATFLIASPCQALTDVYVSPLGDDSFDGTAAVISQSALVGPIRTLERARRLVRQHLEDKHGRVSIKVHLSRGIYRLERPLQFDQRDSPSHGYSVTWTGEGATISGFRMLSEGRSLSENDALELRNSAARAASLIFRDATIAQISRESGPFGFGLPADVAPADLIQGDAILELSRVPDAGYIPVRVRANSSGHISVSSAELPTGHENVVARLLAFWRYAWADETLPAASWNGDRQEWEVTSAHKYGFGATARVRLLNIPEGMSRAGRYYVTKAGELVVTPTNNLPLEVSVLDNLVTLTDVQNISFTGLRFLGGRKAALTISVGSFIEVTQCAFSFVGGDAIRVTGKDILITENRFSDLGGRAALLVGGDLDTLTPSRVVFDRNRIANYGRWFKTYRPAIELAGVGNRVTRNAITNGPHSAIIFGGNDHSIAQNLIVRTCTDTSDVGAIYTGRDWTARGTSIRNNIVIGAEGSTPSGCAAIYLDDQASGIDVEENQFLAVGIGVLLGGGRDNTLTHNTCLDCNVCFQFDGRGLGAQSFLSHDRKGVLWNQLLKAHTRPAYSKYEHLKDLARDDIGAPKYNRATANECSGKVDVVIDSIAKKYITPDVNSVGAAGLSPEVCAEWNSGFSRQGGPLPLSDLSEWRRFCPPEQSHPLGRHS